MNTPTPQYVMPAEVLDAIRKGNKIEAIKLVREQTGLGLKESKDLVDAATPGAGSSMAGAAPGEVPKSGALIGLWVTVLAIAAIAVYLFLRSGR